MLCVRPICLGARVMERDKHGERAEMNDQSESKHISSPVDLTSESRGGGRWNRLCLRLPEILYVNLLLPHIWNQGPVSAYLTHGVTVSNWWFWFGFSFEHWDGSLYLWTQIQADYFFKVLEHSWYTAFLFLVSSRNLLFEISKYLTLYQPALGVQVQQIKGTLK